MIRHCCLCILQDKESALAVIEELLHSQPITSQQLQNFVNQYSNILHECNSDADESSSLNESRTSLQLTCVGESEATKELDANMNESEIAQNFKLERQLEDLHVASPTAEAAVTPELVVLTPELVLIPPELEVVNPELDANNQPEVKGQDGDEMEIEAKCRFTSQTSCLSLEMCGEYAVQRRRHSRKSSTG